MDEDLRPESAAGVGERTPLADVRGRVIRGSMYSIGASAVTLTLGFLRAVLLARLLPPEQFGLVALAFVFVNLAGQLRALSLSEALVHDPQPTEGVYRTFFSLRMGLGLLTAGLLVAAIPLIGRFYPAMPQLAPVLLAFAGADILLALALSQDAVLTRAMAFRTLAFADVCGAVTMIVCAPLLAWWGWGVWALVAEWASGLAARVTFIWVTSPAARPRFGWDAAAARRFMAYGRPSWLASNLAFILARFDDFWVGTLLGKEPLGYYSRAYEFAHYPRRLVANPVLGVFMPAFARLQTDRLRLSQAYFRLTSLTVRVGFWFSLIFVFTAPEFIRLLLGERWLPMQLTFQLMVICTLLDPLMAGAANLFMAIGQPALLARARAVQLVVFLPLVIIMTRLGGIAGVALAVDVRVLIGALLLLRYSRRVVDYSPRTLYVWPVVSVAVTAALMLSLGGLWNVVGLWYALLGKAVVATLCYGILLWLTEREQLRVGVDVVRDIVRRRADRIG
jgi:PST family polysaccharide transporter